MATVTKPIALDESLNTTEVTPRNIADVLADELSNIASKIQGGGSSVSWNQLQVTGDKIAEITISGVKTDVMSHSIAVSRIQTTGTHIADITIDGVKTELYAPQGSPSFNALIIVTAETGKTVTATKGGDTYTATEVSTGTYEVSVDSAGTWTISDGTLSDTVSVVSQTTYYVTLSSVPDGKTVTPTDDVSIWLQCGQRLENYTTLAEVLADSTCLSALMADNNAVDYLVRSKNWCGAGLVPTMTSATTPSGEVICSSVDGTYPAWKAFDGDDTTPAKASATDVSSGAYIGYIFADAFQCDSVKIKSSNSANTNTLRVEVSDDGSTWTSVSSNVTTVYNTVQTISLTTSGKHRYYRLYQVSSNGANSFAFYTIQFCSENICDNSTAMSYIGLNNYCANTLLADSDWCSAICNSTYFESVLNVKVPTMTSNTTPSGVCSADSTVSGAYPYWAFDNDNSTSWIANHAIAMSTPASDAIQYQFNHVVKIFKMSMLANNTRAMATTYALKGSTDGNTYTNIKNESGLSIPANTWYDVLINAEYSHFRLELTMSANSSNVAGHPRLIGLQFYGREDI